MALDQNSLITQEQQDDLNALLTSWRATAVARDDAEQAVEDLIAVASAGAGPGYVPDVFGDGADVLAQEAVLPPGKVPEVLRPLGRPGQRKGFYERGVGPPLNPGSRVNVAQRRRIREAQEAANEARTAYATAAQLLNSRVAKLMYSTPVKNGYAIDIFDSGLVKQYGEVVWPVEFITFRNRRLSL